MNYNLFGQFCKIIFKCFKSRQLTSLILLVWLGWGIEVACKVNDQKMPKSKTESQQMRFSIDSVEMNQNFDSLKTCYENLAKRIKDAECIVKNYQSDANLVMEKANDMISLWLTISTVFVTLIIGLSVWNNYKVEDSYKKNVESLSDNIYRIKKEQEATAQINKIGSIMTCLNSLPDPLLSNSNEDRKKYVNIHLSLMYDEFSAFVKLVNEDARIVSDDRYLQLVLSALKISILRAQGVYSDRLSYFAFYTFTSNLEETEKEIQKSKVTHKEVANILSNILSEFDKFRMELPR